MGGIAVFLPFKVALMLFIVKIHLSWVRTQTSHVNRTALLYRSHAVFVRCEFSHTNCMAEIALHSHQNGAGPFFWSALESDLMGVHTYAIRFLHHFTVRTAICKLIWGCC